MIINTLNIKSVIFFGWTLSGLVFFSCTEKQQFSNENKGDKISLTDEQSRIRNTKVKFMTRNLDLTENEATGFREVYLSYLDLKYQATQKFQFDREDINVEELTDDEFLQILQKTKKLQSEVAQIESDYILKFSKVIPAKKVGKFFQIERKRRDNNARRGIAEGQAKSNSNKITDPAKLIQERFKQQRAKRIEAQKQN